MLRGCAGLLILAVVVRAEMEPHIVGGNYVNIMRYPHSAFLTVSCVNADKDKTNWICGSSVLNQKLLLTAGHCIYSCSSGTQITVNLGDEYRQGGVTRSSSSFLLHEKYEPRTSYYDIGLIKVFRSIKFSSRISRVALMKSPPYGEMAYVAGWGLIDEVTREQSMRLKQVDQKVWKRVDCIKMFGVIPPGTICSSSEKRSDFPAQGDSGSALVVRGYIQIGLVSYKVPQVAANVIIYTDVGYFFSWINSNAAKLFCFTSDYTN